MTTNNHALGVYWAPGHMRQTDMDYMAHLQPPAIRILEADASTMTRAHMLAPRALLLPRDWALSEQHDDMRRDPVGTGRRHAQDWRGKVDAWRAAGMTAPDSQIVAVGINEPRVWESLPQTVDYTVAFLDECTRLGLRGCALNLSVGWPGNHGPDTPPDWTPYAPVQDAIKRGRHFLVVHEYWYRSGVTDGAGWWAWRLQHCPWDVPVIIGECGIDNYVDNTRWNNEGKPPRGWYGNVNAATYADQMAQYVRGLDDRVVAVLPFLTDYRAREWDSFDTGPAHADLLARVHAMQPQGKRHRAHVPIVAAPPAPEPPKLSVGDGLLSDKTINLSISPIPPLVGEAIMAVESGGRSHGPDGDLLIRFEAHIFKAQLGNDALWGKYFRHGARPWEGQEWRAHESEGWRTLHTGNQRDEWAAYDFARALSPEAATRSISMGAPQIMGFNHARIGYPSAEAMRRAFERSAAVQALGFVNFVLGDPALVAAVQARDWRSIARIYNGPGNVAAAAAKYKAAYERLVG